MTNTGKLIDLKGQRFGRLVVTAYAGRNASNRTIWVCSCDCGGSKIIMAKDLRNGRTQSCGCLHREAAGRVNKSHGLTGSPEYQSWRAMINRCYNAKQKSYRRYGALGITVCDRWRHDFAAFYEDMGERPVGKTLDRINPFGNYEPGNCKWSDAAEQAANTRGQLALGMLERLREIHNGLHGHN